MTTPPNTNADDADGRTAPSHSDTQSPDAHAHDSDSGDASSRATLAKNLRATLARRLRTALIFLAVFAALVLLHLTLVELPYYWDEAGYFIPAARDIYTDGSFVPHSTLSNAHPPLVMAYLALAWKLFGFQIAVARVAMLAVSAFALTGLFRLAERVQNTRVAAGCQCRLFNHPQEGRAGADHLGAGAYQLAKPFIFFAQRGLFQGVLQR